MIEGVREREDLSLGRSVGGRVPPRERIDVRTPWWRIVDALLVVTILAVVVIAGNVDTNQMPDGLAEFLAIRMSLVNVLLLTMFGLLWPAVLSACGLYSPARLRLGRDDWLRLVLASTIGGLVALLFALTHRSGTVRPEHALVFGVALFLSTASLRAAVRAVRRARHGSRLPRKIVIVGSGPLAARMYHELRADPMQLIDIVGFVDSEPHPALMNSGAAHLGLEEDLERILMDRVVDDVVIGLPIKSRYEAIHQSIAACERVGVPAKYPADLFRNTRGIPLLDGRVPAQLLSFLVARDDYRLMAKRLIDVVGATMLLMMFAPIMLAVAVAITLTSPGPVLYQQERYGYMKRRFLMHKFRTMVLDAEQLQPQLEVRNEASGPVFKISRDPRLTRVGRFLRRTSLDELPQLWNVVAGEMSLVGPRPLPVRDVGRFAEPWLMRRFSVWPGLTCLWQISGRSELGFEQWIALDLEYIDRWSLLLDAEILLRTIPVVLGGRGAS